MGRNGSIFISLESFNPIMTQSQVTRRVLAGPSPHAGGHGEKMPLEHRILACPSRLLMTSLLELPFSGKLLGG